MPYKKYIVKQGDCISSIAFKYGFFPDTIWNDSKNSKLKQDRKDPNVLMPGDEVYIRDKEEKEESCASEKHHRFKRKGVPEKLILQFKLNGELRSDEPYIVDIDGMISEGKTDKDGQAEIPIPPNAVKGKISFKDTGDEFDLELGHMNPVSETSGVKARLHNLGYDCGPVDETLDEKTEEAIKAFQQDIGLSVSGEVDQATRDALVREHGS